ncbi:hypothetical protein SERLA73DRAFT_176323 [Serpula lacrymans var. lacrymans S7.3]|uniref:F-box domain-containing protein n=2 Tax=Serpula lacrymans var. lacrymans TaxID=341189 RepID=F8PMP6_SERL3|nr:uncharacterized protein SERLADRAFT_459158 [Serpula lacrymans var. lacrymans S7.9]EGO02878.1 hypothetical protein SERLA73DRAFT_176323 [Serpula lacrymans var. lacrymans S7.3]EGO28572.1 hypothetical protein SERLADRAFT_459158 [Serpula lacrymans var. lacrymans S7.9]
MHVESNGHHDLHMSLRRPVFKSYINALPTELLIWIFTYASCVSNGIEFNLALVCRRWRHTLLHLPSIWTRLCISQGTSIDKARLYIQRSNDGPLYLDADLTYSTYDDDYYVKGRGFLQRRIKSSERQDVVELLFSCMDRWKCLDLTVLGDHNDYQVRAQGVAGRTLRKFVDIYVPLLENFGVNAFSQSCMTVIDFRPPIHFFQRGAPMLTHLRLCQVGPDICSVPSATSTLTSLSVETYHHDHQLTAYELFAYLRKLPALTHLHLKEDFYCKWYRIKNIVPLPNLVSLCLELGPECCVAMICEIFVFFVAPHLEHFSLTPAPAVELSLETPYDIIGEEEIERLPNFLVKFVSNPPFPLLESLVLHFPAIPDKVINFFRVFPTVCNVSLAEMNSKEMIKEMLKGHACEDPPSNAPLLWPNLQTLILQDWNVSDEFELLLELLHVRERAGSPIKQLKLRSTKANTFTPISPLQRSKLDELVSVELDIDPPFVKCSDSLDSLMTKRVTPIW